MKNPDRKYYFGNPGHRLAVSEWGSVGNPVILFIHGFPGCADQGGLLMSTPHANRFRLIAFDRPGYGDSDFQKKLTPVSLAHQIRELINQHQIENLNLLSVSGGAPFAWALAHVLGSRVQKLSSVSGVAPLTMKNFRFMNQAQRRAWLMRNFIPTPILRFGMKRIWSKGLDRVDEMLFSNVDQFSVPDQNVFKNDEIAPHLIGTVKTALQPGPNGILHDMKIYSRAWGFPIRQVGCQVTLWHGERDDVVSCEYSLEMKRHFPNAQLKLIPGEGHYSLPLNFRDLIIEDLIGL